MSEKIYSRRWAEGHVKKHEIKFKNCPSNTELLVEVNKINNSSYTKLIDAWKEIANEVKVSKPKKRVRRVTAKYERETKRVTSDNFLKSYDWKKLRYEALQLHGRKCQCCGVSPDTGAVLNVDHIKPRRKFPELALELSNLQVLCASCNHGKGNWDETDFRPKENKIITRKRNGESWLEILKTQETSIQ